MKLLTSPFIDDVQIADLTRHSDNRGFFNEAFRREWFPERDWSRIQLNHSSSAKGVLRGLHYHHHQVDYWYVPFGRIRVVLADLRPESPTFKVVQILELIASDPQGLFIPPGVAHGFIALTDSILLYVVNNYYDGSDEHGLAWNDPDLAIDWGIDRPEVSERDRANPTLREILEQ